MTMWTGWGYVVAFFAVIGIVIGVAILPNHEMIGLAVGLLLAAGATYGLVSLLGRRRGRVLLDPATNQRVVVPYGDSLLSVPIRLWTWIFVALSVLSIVWVIFRR